MRDGGMALLLLGVKSQDKRQLPQIHPLHEVIHSILCSTMDVTGLIFPDMLSYTYMNYQWFMSWLTSLQGRVKIFFLIGNENLIPLRWKFIHWVFINLLILPQLFCEVPLVVPVHIVNHILSNSTITYNLLLLQHSCDFQFCWE